MQSSLMTLQHYTHKMARAALFQLSFTRLIKARASLKLVTTSLVHGVDHDSEIHSLSFQFISLKWRLFLYGVFCLFRNINQCTCENNSRRCRTCKITFYHLTTAYILTYIYNILENSGHIELLGSFTTVKSLASESLVYFVLLIFFRAQFFFFFFHVKSVFIM